MKRKDRYPALAIVFEVDKIGLEKITQLKIWVVTALNEVVGLEREILKLEQEKCKCEYDQCICSNQDMEE